MTGQIGTTVPKPAPSVLAQAENAVYGDRARDYGHPRKNFRRIAILWQAHIYARYGILIPFDDLDVGMLNILQKDARLMETLKHRDSYTDIAGYAGATARAIGLDD